ncbi:MAG TPA: hypothetical protein VMK83_02070, partial [Gaiellaceae bacterium]|nr:hypothetical protein [Gaiellaceae bacterium]
LAHVAGLPAFRQELLDARATLEWLAAYPDGPETYAFPSSSASGLRKPVERTLGTTARVEYARVLEVLEEDAAALVDAFSDEQKQRLGITTERTPLKEAMWDDDDHKAWKKQELERARGLLPWARDPNGLAAEASDFRA